MEEKVLYHATFVSHLESIFTYGLGAKQPKNWAFSRDRLVYLASDPDAAVSFCECAEETPDAVYESGIALLEVDISGLEPNLRLDENMKDADWGPLCLAYPGVIPPEKLSVLRCPA